MTTNPSDRPPADDLILPVAQHVMTTLLAATIGAACAATDRGRPTNWLVRPRAAAETINELVAELDAHNTECGTRHDRGDVTEFDMTEYRPFLEQLAGALENLATIATSARRLAQAIDVVVGTDHDPAGAVELAARLGRDAQQAAVTLANHGVATPLAWPALVAADPPLDNMALWMLANLTDDSPVGKIVARLIADGTTATSSDLIDAAKNTLRTPHH